MHTTGRKNPPRLNPELSRRYAETARMLRDLQQRVGTFGYPL